MNSSQLISSLVLAILATTLHSTTASRYTCPSTKAVGICGATPIITGVVQGGVDATKIASTNSCKGLNRASRICCPDRAPYDVEPAKIDKCVGPSPAPQADNFICQGPNSHGVCGDLKAGTATNILKATLIDFTFSCDHKRQPQANCCAAEFQGTASSCVPYSTH